MQVGIINLASPYAVNNGGKFLSEFFVCTSRRIGTVEAVHMITWFSSQGLSQSASTGNIYLWVVGEAFLWIRNLNGTKSLNSLNDLEKGRRRRRQCL